MLNFLENHDEQRIASDFFAGDAERALPALVVSACMNTNPFMAVSYTHLDVYKRQLVVNRPTPNPIT